MKARILKWFAIPFSSGACIVRSLHHDLSILGGPTVSLAHSFFELDKAVDLQSRKRALLKYQIQWHPHLGLSLQDLVLLMLSSLYYFILAAKLTNILQYVAWLCSMGL